MDARLGKFDVAKKDALLCSVQLLSAMMLGVFNQDDSDNFISTAFFGSSGKCGDCKATLQPDWKVCPYCEKRLVKFSEPEARNLARRISTTLVKLCFLLDFSLTTTTDGKWSAFESYHFERLAARETLINAILSVLAEPLSGSLEELSSRRFNRWIDSVISAPKCDEFFYSILTLSLTKVQPGWLSGMYAEDKRESLRRSCLNLVLILLCGRISSDESYDVGYEERVEDKNLLGEFLIKVAPPLAFDSIVDMLADPEMFAYGCGLLWNFVIYHREFCDYINERSEDIVCPIVVYIMQGKEDVKNHGAINLGIFILLALSSRRSFGVALNAPLTLARRKTLPKNLSIKESNPCVADVLFISFEAIIATGFLDALDETLLMILCNISPFSKTLCMTSSISLMRLFVMFSSRVSLLRSERAHEYLALVLDSISNVLQYQYEGNRPLTYAVISYRDRFNRLFDIISDAKLTVDEFRGDRIEAQSFHTPEWFINLRKMLPVKVVQKVLLELVPTLERLDATHSESVIHAISKTTIVGVLPPAPPIVIRRTSRSKETDVWIATFIWSVAYNGNKNLSELSPKLFQI